MCAERASRMSACACTRIKNGLFFSVFVRPLQQNYIEETQLYIHEDNRTAQLLGRSQPSPMP